MAYTDIDDPSAYFQTVLWTGNDSNPRTISHDGNSDMQPDWLWHKVRNGASSHMMYDSSRGVGKRLHTNQNVAEATETAAGSITAFTSDGFTVDAGTSTDFYVNDSAQTYVSWGWKANGGTTTTNDASATGIGTIDSVIQANTTAGFSIVTYTGTGSNGTVAHGLGVVPKFVIYKRRSAVENWGAYHTSTGNTGCCFLNLDITKSSAAAYFNNTSPTSTTLSVGSSPAFNGDGSTYVAYCFAEKKGYSKFGSYIGNGNNNGTFVHLGFKPAWVMTKRTDTANQWPISDNARNPFNVVDISSYANLTSDANTVSNHYDSVSNGFKLRGTSTGWNTSGGTYIYMAFAESPFVSSTGVPTTAR